MEENSPAMNEGEPGLPTASNASAAEAATQQRYEVQALQSHLLNRIHSQNMDNHQRFNEMQERFEQRLEDVSPERPGATGACSGTECSERRS